MKSFTTPKMGARVTAGALTKNAGQPHKKVWQFSNDEDRRRSRNHPKVYRRILQSI